MPIPRIAREIRIAVKLLIIAGIIELTDAINKPKIAVLF